MAEPGSESETITISLTRAQIDALYYFASKGREEWMYDRSENQEVFDAEDIAERNELLSECDKALVSIEQVSRKA